VKNFKKYTLFLFLFLNLLFICKQTVFAVNGKDKLPPTQPTSSVSEGKTPNPDNNENIETSKKRDKSPDRDSETTTKKARQEEPAKPLIPTAPAPAHFQALQSSLADPSFIPHLPNSNSLIPSQPLDAEIEMEDKPFLNAKEGLDNFLDSFISEEIKDKKQYKKCLPLSLLEKLPPDIIQYICSYLGLPSLKIINLLNKNLSKINFPLNGKIQIAKRLNKRGIAYLLKKFPKLKILTISDLYLNSLEEKKDLFQQLINEINNNNFTSINQLNINELILHPDSIENIVSAIYENKLPNLTHFNFELSEKISKLWIEEYQITSRNILKLEKSISEKKNNSIISIENSKKYKR
jgi:hypothetical protein